MELDVRDDRARLAFVEGQCHNVALALHRRKDWPLVAIDDEAGDCVHVCARDPKGRLADIRGFHPAGEVPVANSRVVRNVDESYIAGLTENDWAPVNPDAAEP